jgi:ABC-type glycerol-3-phosphate transport system substrate-binding protein
MNRVRLVVGVLGASALALSACGIGGSSSSGGRVPLTVWGENEGGIGPFLDELETSFEKEYPNIDLQITNFPEESYGVKLDTAIAAGKEPDIRQGGDPEAYRSGTLLPLDDMIKTHHIDLSNYVQSIVTPGDEFSCAYEGHLYCIGSYAGSVQLLYNKDMFDAAGIPAPKPWPPMTPEEFVSIACQLTDKDAGVWGAAASDPLAYVPWEVFFSADGRTATFNSPEAVHQFEVLADGYENGCFPTSNIVDPWEQGRDFFVQKQLAMVITDYQSLDKIEESGINWGTTASPTPAGYEPYFFVWTDSFGISSTSDHIPQAEDFLTFLTTQGQKIRAETEGSLPLDLQVAKQINWAQGITGRQEGLEVLSHARPTNFVPERWDIIGPYYDAWDYVISGEKTAQEALDEANAAIQEDLDKAWEHWEESG